MPHSLTIPVELNDEQFDAMNDFVAEWNGEQGTSTPEERLREDAIMPFVQTKVQAAYDKALRELGEKGLSVPYTTRKELLRQVRESVAAAAE